MRYLSGGGAPRPAPPPLRASPSSSWILSWSGVEPVDLLSALPQRRTLRRAPRFGFNVRPASLGFGQVRERSRHDLRAAGKVQNPAVNPGNRSRFSRFVGFRTWSRSPMGGPWRGGSGNVVASVGRLLVLPGSSLAPRVPFKMWRVITRRLLPDRTTGTRSSPVLIGSSALVNIIELFQ